MCYSISGKHRETGHRATMNTTKQGGLTMSKAIQTWIDKIKKLITLIYDTHIYHKQYKQKGFHFESLFLI